MTEIQSSTSFRDFLRIENVLKGIRKLFDIFLFGVLWIRSVTKRMEGKRVNVEISALPDEILEAIFSHLPAYSLKSCRLVSPKWLNVIDKSQRFSVKFNDQANDHSSFPPWHVTKCFIGSYETDSKFILYPEHLKSLTIWGRITPQNFIALLKSTVNLEELNLANEALQTIGGRGLFEIDGSNQQVNLNRVQKVSLHSLDTIGNVDKSLLGLFQQESMNNLTKLKINMGHHAQFRVPVAVTQDFEASPEVKVAINLARCVSHQKNLKTLHVDISPEAWMSSRDLENLMAKLNREYKLDQELSSLKLFNCRLVVGQLYIKLLRRLLISQENLRDIRLRHQSLEFPMIESSLLNSMRSLVSIELQSLSFPEVGDGVAVAVLDFLIFQEAEYLKHLKLERVSSSASRMALIRNLRVALPSLETLKLKGFNCNSEDIKGLATNPDYKSLKVVGIVDSGNWDENGMGIDGAVANALCMKPGLEVLTMGPLKNRTPWVYGERYEDDPEYECLRRKLGHWGIVRGKVVTINFKSRSQVKQEDCNNN